MTLFDTVADAMNPNTRPSFPATGLPQLDRIAPLIPGRVMVMVGTSGVGKTRVCGHIAATINCLDERGVLIVSTPTTLEAVDSSLAFAKPALCLIDPLSTLAAPHGAAPAELIPAPRTAADDDTPLQRGPGLRASDTDADDAAGRRPIHPAELGRLAEGLRELARAHRVPILACHRYSPTRDSLTGNIVSTEAVNPLLDAVDVVVVARVQPDPAMIGLEIMRNAHGPVMTIKVPLGTRVRR